MFGLNFGATSSKSNTTSTIDKTDTQNQTSDQTNVGVQNTSSGTQSAGASQSAGTSATSGTTSSTGATTGAQQETSSTSSLPADVLSGLANTIKSLLAGAVPAAQAASAGAVGKVSAFDPASYLANANQAAQSQAKTALDASTTNIFQRLGGTADTNSMAALLSQQMRDSSAASLAGTQANNAATAAQILNANANTAVAAQNPILSLLPALASILKGGDITSTGATATQQANTQTGAQASNTATSESSTQQQASQTDTVQTLVNLISSIMQGTDHTVGTDTSATKSSGMSFGASVGVGK